MSEKRAKEARQRIRQMRIERGLDPDTKPEPKLNPSPYLRNRRQRHTKWPNDPDKTKKRISRKKKPKNGGKRNARQRVADTIS